MGGLVGKDVLSYTVLGAVYPGAVRLMLTGGGGDTLVRIMNTLFE